MARKGPRWLAIAMIMTGACDPSTQPEVQDGQVPRPAFDVEVGDQEAPPEVPEPYRSLPVSVHTTSYPSVNGGIATAQAYVTFVGPAGEAWVNLISSAGTKADTVQRWNSWYDFAGGNVNATAQLALPSGVCIGVVTSDAGGAVWKYFLAWKWGRRESYDTKAADCPAQDPCTESGGGYATIKGTGIVASSCGGQTGSPGGSDGGDAPLDAASPNCQWVR